MGNHYIYERNIQHLRVGFIIDSSDSIIVTNFISGSFSILSFLLISFPRYQNMLPMSVHVAFFSQVFFVHLLPKQDYNRSVLCSLNVVHCVSSGFWSLKGGLV